MRSSNKEKYAQRPAQEIHDSIKILFLGDQATGKNSIIRSAQGKEHVTLNDIKPLQNQVFVTTEENKTVRCDIWNPGDKRTLKKNKASYFNPDAIVFVADSTNRDSFKDIEKDWIPLAKEISSSEPLKYFALNKMDLPEAYVVEPEPAASKFKNLGFTGSYAVSAKAGTDIDFMMKGIVTECIANRNIKNMKAIKEQNAQLSSTQYKTLITDLTKYVDSGAQESKPFFGTEYSKDQKVHAAVALIHALQKNDPSLLEEKKEEFKSILRDGNLGDIIRDYVKKNHPNGTNTVSDFIDNLCTERAPGLKP